MITETKIIEFIRSYNPCTFGFTKEYSSISIESMTSGESNMVYVVNIDNTRFVVKANGVISKEKTFFFNEYNKLNVLRKWDISPAPYISAYIDDTPILVLEYVEGLPLTCKTLELHIDGVIEILNRISTIPLSYLSRCRCFRSRFKNCYDYAMMIINYASVQLNNYRERCGEDEFYSYVRTIIPKSLEYLQTSRKLFLDASFGLIHTGFHPGNLILSNNGSIKAIDWEHANIGDRAFEIAGLLRHICLSKRMVAYIINRYKGADKYIFERSKVYTQIFKLHECLWHAIRIHMVKNGELHLSEEKTSTYFSRLFEEKMVELRQAEYAI